MASKEFNIIMGIISFIVVLCKLSYYQTTDCVFIGNLSPLCGPGAKYLTIAFSIFFIIFGLNLFRLAWKQHQQEKKDKQNKL